MNRILFAFLACFTFNHLSAQFEQQFNLDQIVQVNDYFQGTRSYNDIWGFEDQNGREYAILGAREAFIIYDITNPSAPQEVAFIPGSRSIWRDMKTYGNYIYGISDRTTDGLVVINMENAPNNITWEFQKPILTAGLDTQALEDAHNLFIDENGILYIAGSNISDGGILMMDLKDDPGKPAYIGPATNRYSHDVFVRGDTVYSSDINNGFFSITSVANKQSPELLALQNTSRNYTHNSWLSDDGNYLYTTDERSNAFVDAYDISDLDNISRVDAYRPLATEGTGVVPHNVHYFNDFLVISYYSDGVKIVDAHRPDNLIEVGSFDTSPQTGAGDGCWGVFPYLKSGVILASDMEEGLFILNPNYQRAAYLEGVVIDANTKRPLPAVEVSINSTQSNFDRSRPDGQFKTGLANGGTFSVTFSLAGYEPLTKEYTLENGLVIDDVVELVPIPIVSLSGRITSQSSSQGIAGQLTLTNSSISYDVQADETGQFTLENIVVGSYELWVGAWGYRQQVLSEVDIVNEETLNFQLASGFEDDFYRDLGWTSSSTARTGDWVRVVPIGNDFEGALANPDADLDNDFGASAYVTGNGEGGSGLFDVDDGVVTLTSPIMDLSDYENPEMQFSYWFYNGAGEGTPDDQLLISLTNGITTVDLALITENTDRWEDKTFLLTDLIELTDSMQLIVETFDLGNPHLVEVGFDGFSVVDLIATNSIDLFDQKIELSIFPNPSRDQFNVQFEIPDTFESLRLNLFNQYGQQLSSRLINQREGFVTLGEDLPIGIYWVQLQDRKGRQLTRKIIKQ